LEPAIGALLLFLTNYLSILLAGGGVLTLLGLSRATTVEIGKRARRNAFVAIGVGVLIVAIPLAFTSVRVIETARTQRQAKTVIETWVDETAFEIREIDTDFLSRRVDVIISGSGETPPSFPELVTDLETTLNSPIEAKLEIISSQTLTHPEPVSEPPD
jgi:hypothetical protein